MNVAPRILGDYTFGSTKRSKGREYALYPSRCRRDRCRRSEASGS